MIRAFVWLWAMLLGASAPAADSPARGAEGLRIATFAGGCFWCMEAPFDVLPGVLSTTSGYTGGHAPDPVYQAVSAGITGHAEAVQIAFDPNQISYEKLLAVFWRNIDPTTPDRQFCDRGSQYRSAIFFHGEAQQRLAISSRDRIAASGVLERPIVTQIEAASRFYPAEDAHQDYYRKNPIRYKAYRYGCGRDRRLKKIWGQAPSPAGGESDREESQ